MKEEIKRYKKLNELAKQNGIVIFGSKEDTCIPLGELRQAFSIESEMYNRSFTDLSIANALSLYDECVAPLSPETLLIHIGVTDFDSFLESPSDFDLKFQNLVEHIRTTDPNCRIAIISMKNYNNNPLIEELNTHLKYIANSEQCEYGDIATKKVWNPQSTMEAVSFVYSIGFVRPLKNKRPLYDLVKMLFCYDI